MEQHSFLLQDYPDAREYIRKMKRQLHLPKT